MPEKQQFCTYGEPYTDGKERDLHSQNHEVMHTVREEDEKEGEGEGGLLQKLNLAPLTP
jgi:hypothetical protein